MGEWARRSGQFVQKTGYLVKMELEFTDSSWRGVNKDPWIVMTVSTHDREIVPQEGEPLVSDVPGLHHIEKYSYNEYFTDLPDIRRDRRPGGLDGTWSGFLQRLDSTRDCVLRIRRWIVGIISLSIVFFCSAQFVYSICYHKYKKMAILWNIDILIDEKGLPKEKAHEKYIECGLERGAMWRFFFGIGQDTYGQIHERVEKIAHHHGDVPGYGKTMADYVHSLAPSRKGPCFPTRKEVSGWCHWENTSHPSFGIPSWFLGGGDLLSCGEISTCEVDGWLDEGITVFLLMVLLALIIGAALGYYTYWLQRQASRTLWSYEPQDLSAFRFPKQRRTSARWFSCSS